MAHESPEVFPDFFLADCHSFNGFTILCVLRAWNRLGCRNFRHTIGRIIVYQAADLSTVLPASSGLLSPYFLHLGYDGAYALRPHSRLWCGFGYRFIQAATALSLASDVRCSLCFGCRWFFVLLCSISVIQALSPSILLLLHLFTSSVITLRPFALYLYSWRVLLFGGR